MSLALVHSRAKSGVQAPAVRVEVYLAAGLPVLNMVGLPEAAVRESRDRVRAAISCAQLEFPNRRITVNLAPADLPKDGGRFDLPLALGILAANGAIDPQALNDYEFIGELALTGELRAIDGVLPAALAAKQAGRRMIVPVGNAAEAGLARAEHLYTARTLMDVVHHLRGERMLPIAYAGLDFMDAPMPDMADVRGQHSARRAMEIAAAGGHHMLLIGSPGCGKTLLASRLPGILPPASDAEAIENAAITSVSGKGLDLARFRQRPFRSPHHTSSAVALAGGGTQPKPGEISLAHQGVLFLDELAEWDRKSLEVLRQPLESGTVSISRAATSAEFPARFQLVAAMNPCPCGWYGDSSGRCRCSPDAIERYRGKLSGPLLDRIDIHLAMTRLSHEELHLNAPLGEPSAVIRARVCAARALQMQRSGVCNAHLSQADLKTHCQLDAGNQELLDKAMNALQLSARATYRILRVARTIADLAGSPDIGTPHLAEAIQYRQLDRALAVPKRRS
ncbi:MAG: YifB family Mg chelatase-like AAA ATPase [Arenimonas sp.]|uniref:YifB family Mg chelatase-like AAA ATPase n=1 Tax=Arenimonas sp. TaxID=1872635 RepID=UPI003C1098E4